MKKLTVRYIVFARHESKGFNHLRDAISYFIALVNQGKNSVEFLEYNKTTDKYDKWSNNKVLYINDCYYGFKEIHNKIRDFVIANKSKKELETVYDYKNEYTIYLH